MNIIAVDDERLALEDFIDVCSELEGIDNINTFTNPADALEHALLNPVDVAFLDIEMPVMSGIDLAQRLIRINSDTKVIFITGFKDYAFDAFSVNAIGYVLKPYSADMIEKELLKASRITKTDQKPSVQAKTFGYFDVFINNRPVYFSSAKAKELLALLVDHRGGSVSTEVAVRALWPGRIYDNTVQSLFRKVLQSLRTSLSDAGVSEIFMDTRNQRSVDVSKFDCDLYRLLDLEETAVAEYSGEYMIGYSWAAPTKKHIERILGEDGTYVK